MKIRINPVFIASIMRAENGPYGEEYNGIKYTICLILVLMTEGR